MPAKRSQTRAKPVSLDRNEQDEARRSLCTSLGFWKFCGNRKCRRAKGCVGEAAACFARLWPLVPAETKALVRVFIRSSAAGRAPHEIAADLECERLRHEPAAPPVAETATPQAAVKDAAPVAPPKPRLRML
jgi:hypothetical protein